MDLVNTIAVGLGMAGAVDLYLLIIFLGGIIFLAKDLKIGLIFYLLMWTLGYIFFELQGFETKKLLIAMFLTVLLMAISLYSGYQKQGSAV